MVSVPSSGHKMLFDSSMASDWLDLLHGSNNGFINVVSTSDFRGGFYPTTAEGIDAAVARMQKLHDAGEQGVYVRCTTVGTIPERGRGRREDSLSIPGLWADIDLAGPGHAAVNLPPDLETAKEIIRQASLPQPTLWIHSGGGLYPWWLLQEDGHNLDVTENRNGWARISLQWHKALESGAKRLGYTYETGTHDLARVLRVPGTVNRKAGLERRCEIIESDGAYFTGEELREFSDSAFELIPKTIPVPAPIREMTGSGSSPLDDFEARTDWAEILEPEGWSFVRYEGWSRLWRHPSATADVSASTGHDQGRDRLFMFSTSIAGLPAQEPHTKQFVWAHYNTRGNMSKAASELYKAGFGDRHEPSVNVLDSAPKRKETSWVSPERAIYDPEDSTPGVRGGEQEPLGPVERPDVQYKVREREWDDLGNAYRFMDRFGHRVRWIEMAGTWAVYSGGRWALDRTAKMRQLVVEMVDAMRDEEECLYSDEPNEGSQGRETESDRKKFRKFVSKTRSAAGQRALMECLRGVILADGTPIAAELDEFDQHQWLLNCKNCIVDLRTGETIEHDPKYMMMQQAPTDYIPSAFSPKWDKFLSEVMPDPEMQTYLQQITGYSMTGSIREQALFMHVGVGANGKSVYLDVLAKITSDYCQSVPRTALLITTNDGHPTEIARMMGKRFLQVSETAPGRRLNEELVKSLTGGETINARFMNKDFFEFRPTGKIHYVTNNLPHVSSAESIWRRAHLIRWGVTIEEENKNRELAAEIVETDAAGVLAWIVAGAIDWYKAGKLRKPACAQEDLDAYREDEDDLGEFMTDTFIRTEDEGDRITMDSIYAQYQHWCMGSGVKTMSKQSLSRILNERRFVKFRTNMARGFCKIKMKPGVAQWAGGLLMNQLALEG